MVNFHLPPPPLGNRYALKLKSPEIRRKAYDAYCAWIAKGKVKRSFVFEDDESDLTCTAKTLDSYIKENPGEFPVIKKEVAECHGFAFWEEVCDLSAQGKNKAVTPSLQMVMRNKFGWDAEKKVDENTEQQKIEALNRLSDAVHPSSAQKPLPSDQ